VIICVFQLLCEHPVKPSKPFLKSFLAPKELIHTSYKLFNDYLEPRRGKLFIEIDL